MKLLNSIILSPRYYDQDGFRHINNANYLSYIEEGRIHFLIENADIFQDFLNHDKLLVITSLEAHFLQPGFYHRNYKINTYLDDLKKIRGTFYQEIEDQSNAKKVFAAEVNWVILDKKLKPIPVNDTFEKLILRKNLQENPQGERAFTAHLKKTLETEKTRAKLIDKIDFNYHKTSIKTKISELDSYRHINNSAFFVYFEEARWHLLQSIGMDSNQLWTQESSAVLSAQYINYRNELFGMKDITIESAFLEIFGASALIYHRLKNADGELCAEAIAEVVSFHLGQERPVRWPKSMSEPMRQYLL